jgi:hypothetical protein
LRYGERERKKNIPEERFQFLSFYFFLSREKQIRPIRIFSKKFFAGVPKIFPNGGSIFGGKDARSLQKLTLFDAMQCSRQS